jgi:membrane protease YdiL (CAAX protease family)
VTVEALTILIRSHPLLAYFALAFAISWGGVLAAVVGSGAMDGTGPTNDSRFLFAVLAMLAGPSVAGIFMTAVLEGRNGVRALGARVLRWQVGARWFALALLMAPVLWLLTLLALSLTSLNLLPGIVTSTDKAGLVLVGVGVALGAGILEEIGWTGFAIPQLRRHHGALATGAIVGVLWGAWHLLTNVFWAAPATAGELPLSIFLPASALGALIGYVPAFRILMVWAYDRTGSLLVAMLMHTSLTASVLILDPAGLSGVALLTYSFALAAVVWAVVIAVGMRSGWHLHHKAAPSAHRAAGEAEPA